MASKTCECGCAEPVAQAWSHVTPGGPWGPTEYGGGLRLAEPDGAP